MKTLCLCLALLVWLVPLPAHAQDEPECEPDLTAAAELWDAAQVAMADGELVVALDSLRELRRELALIDSQCLGLNGEYEAGTQVIGAVIIPEGLYTLTVTIDGVAGEENVEASVEIVAGECGGGTGDYLETNVISLFYSELTGSYLFTSRGCEMFWQVSTASAPFTMEWVKLK